MANGWGGKRKGAGHPFDKPLTKEQQEKRLRTIKINQILRRLNQHVMGTVEMSPSAVTAAAILLRKVIPDLQSIDHTGILHVQPAAKMKTDDINRELDATARALEGITGSGRHSTVTH